MATLSGYFTGTGQSATVSGDRIGIYMDFAGTASVDVEVQMASGAWIKVITAVVADYAQVYDANGVALRLNCTAHTNNVEYMLVSSSP